jgi:alkylhydroperoxidase family enzyme
VGRASGVTEEQMLALPEHATSPAFSDLERLVLDYAVLLTNTPVTVPDEVFARLRGRLDEGEIVELTAAIAWENYRARYNHALGIEAQGFSEGAVCALPERTGDGVAAKA